MNDRGSQTILAGIVTNWSQVNDPVRFVARYAPAIRNYLHALIRDPHEADDAAQEFLTKIGQRGFQELTLQKGKRFRDYLIAAVRNAARTHLKNINRRHQQEQQFFETDFEDSPDAIDEQWIAEWRKCALDRALTALHRRERTAPESLCYTVLKSRLDSTDARDTELAEQLSMKLGRMIKPDAFRKQLSRSRRILAELLVLEVAETLQQVTPQEVEDELIATGLMEFVRPFLPPDWREQGILTPPEE